MKKIILLILFTSTIGLAQVQDNNGQSGRKGTIFFYWGWNRGWFSNSDITFSGDNYDFTLKDAAASDRQSKFELGTYLNPGTATIPQYNFRIGYYITNHYNISLGFDHMKYVLNQNQIVKISGKINNTGTVYDKTYSNENINIQGGFLLFEHTNGLNYVNLEFRRIDEIYKYKNISINLTEGLGAGILVPKTNTTLLNFKRYDEFHLSGYGIDAIVGLNVTFFNFFFVQSEFKQGYINMPDIRTTIFDSDRASQHFFFSQFNIVFGTNISL